MWAARHLFVLRTPWAEPMLRRADFAYFERLYELVPELHDVRLSVHCHDDLGMAVANS